MIGSGAEEPVMSECQATNYLQKELGELTPAQLEAVTAALRIFAAEMRSTLKLCGRAFQYLFPEHDSPCGTCAMQPSTDDWPGFAATWYGVFVSIRDTKPFLCHETQSGWEAGTIDLENLKLCTGVLAVFASERVRCAIAVVRLQQEIETAVGSSPSSATAEAAP